MRKILGKLLNKLPFVIQLRPWFYKYQGSAIPPGQSNNDIKNMFYEFGDIYDQIYSISKAIIKRKKWSKEELKKAKITADKIGESNCDFRFYHMKDAIKHGIFCEEYRRRDNG